MYCFYISFEIADGTILLGGGRNGSGPIGDVVANEMEQR